MHCLRKAAEQQFQCNAGKFHEKHNNRFYTLCIFIQFYFPIPRSKKDRIMVKMKKLTTSNYVGAFSILEVIVSTIIILIAFMLFSFLLGQLMSSRRMVPETAILLKMPSFRTANGITDTMAINNVYNQSSTSTTNELLNSFAFQHVKMGDKNSGKLLLQYYALPDTLNADNLFQQ